VAEGAKAGGGLRNVVVSESAISSIDGARGELAYRGVDIHELARHSTFEETAYLLREGSLPDRRTLEAFRRELASEREVPAEVLALVRGLARGHPMVVLRTAVSALGALEAEDGQSSRRRTCLRLIAQMGTLVAAIGRTRAGEEPLLGDPSLGHAANFLFMLTGGRPSAAAERAIDTALVLHADHEFNASTFAARVAASTLSDVHGCVTAAISTLKGPLHGGANEAVMRTLQEIDSVDRVLPWVKEAFLSKRKVMGFGHAVYRTEDPRCTHLRALSREVSAKKGDLRWYALSEGLEAAVRAEKGLFANVDFYSASLYHVLGIETPLFTPTFAVSRIAGWTAHIEEQLDHNRLIRPESEYSGPTNVPYVPLDQR